MFRVGFMMIFAGLLLLPMQVSRAGSPIEAFYGHYVGEAEELVKGETAKRNLDVIISPYKKGFTVEWTTVIHRASGKTKHANFSINFKQMGKKPLYRSAMRVNAFGQEIPLDPLDGDPYVWGVLAGKVLTVNSLIILPDGEYEMQSYIRKLTGTGMDVTFTRVRNGAKLKDLHAKLKRVEG